MAQIPQINNPITAKNYNYSSRPMDENTEPFDIVKLTGVGGAGVSSDAGTRSRLEMGNRELIPLSVQVAKDPTLAVETLKDLLNVEVLNQALITGHTELYGKLEDLATNLYVTPEELVQEIQNQEQQNTMFSGHEFYDVLREVAKTTTDPTTKEIIGNLLKSLNFAQNKNEILGALKANMKFLSEYFSPNEKLSAKLMNLSQQWGADDAEQFFDYLKSETLAILKDVSGSLLNDDKTQMLIPLITHNLSRYNNSPYMCKEYFNLLLSQTSSGTLRESLKNSFSRLYSALFVKKDMSDPSAAKGTQRSPQMGAAAEQASVTASEGNNTQIAAEQKLPNSGNMNTASEEIPLDNYTTNLQQNQPFESNSTEKNSNFFASENDVQQNVKTTNENFVENDQPEVEIELKGYQKFLHDSMSEKSFMPLLKHSGYNIERMMSTYARGKTSGMETLEKMVEGLFVHDETGEQFKAFTAEFSKINTMQEAIDKLNELLRAMPDIPIRERLYGAFVDVIEQMAVRNELPQHGVRPPVSSTLDCLT
ncbi:MAG: hypothetical protein E7478_02025, partial [Ruminococcaceae bacterium]|nr:hypothetical protein [Oscillospiraceae bacterium]